MLITWSIYLELSFKSKFMNYNYKLLKIDQVHLS